jgi:hypothetical protein
MPDRVAPADRSAPRWTPHAHIIQTICAIVAGSRTWDTPEDLTPAQQARVERYVATHPDWVCRLIGRAIAAAMDIQNERRRTRRIP